MKNLRLRQSTTSAAALIGIDVYRGLCEGDDVYVGITNALSRRQRQHGERFVIEAMNKAALTRGEARAIEEAMLTRNGFTWSGGRYDNTRHSISPAHSYHHQAVSWGESWLQGNGFPR